MDSAPFASVPGDAPTEDASETILEIRDLRVRFDSIVGTTRAVNGVDLTVRRGEIHGLVGESGCGKSVTARSVAGLVPSPPAIFESGTVVLNTRSGRVDVLKVRNDERALRAIRGSDVSMIFQEPMRSLHPMMTVGSQILEAILAHEGSGAAKALTRAETMLDLVGLPQPQRLLSRYPHELSGGMRQRVMIALALVGSPQLLLADEPTTALDVTIQAQILDLLSSLSQRLDMSVLLITHDLGVVATTADRVSVMYLGTIIETGTVFDIFETPKHPYTRGLLRSIPSLVGEPKTPLASLPGVVPELAHAPVGCVFADRCPYCVPKCLEYPPPMVGSASHQVACWLCSSKTRVESRGTTFSTGLDNGQHGTQDHSLDRTRSRGEQSAGMREGQKPAPKSAVFHESEPSRDDSVKLRTRGLSLYYPIFRGVFRRRVGVIRAVDSLDLTIRKGEVLGLVGESGCGKTSVGRLLTRLARPTDGSVEFAVDGHLLDISSASEKELKGIRRHMGMVFQDPLSSLDPRMSVRDIVGEPLMLHSVAHGKGVDSRVGELLESVGLRSEHQRRFPHAFSGGQRQRIAVARSLALQPEFLVADEPVSALDVSVQSQVLNLLMELQQSLRLTMLFIAHDIAVVRHVSDRVAVMYLGRLVEIGDTEHVCCEPFHPYTEALLASIPLPVPGRDVHRVGIRGDLPDPAHPPSGCPFHTRCPYSQEICVSEQPALRPLRDDPGHLCACHFRDELHLKGVRELTRSTIN